MSDDVKMAGQFIFFWSGWPSQWFKSTFVIDGVHYNCAEQFMMAEKARVFGDDESLAAILRSKSPREQKALGRSVRKFDADEWNRLCRGVVYTASLAKFSQNETLGTLLRETGDRTIVEASPKDRIWGIGLGADDPRSLDESRWRGTNWLGIALMQVRQTLRSEAAGEPAVLDSELQGQLDHRRGWKTG
jgi:ribA/ribD-fused uncharacterized protein